MPPELVFPSFKCSDLIELMMLGNNPSALAAALINIRISEQDKKLDTHFEAENNGFWVVS